MFATPNMGLTAWDLGSDPYDHAQLAANFSQIDQHDHSVGKGIQIPTTGIANLAITSAKINTDAVLPTSHIPVDSIPQSRLADDSVGAGELQDNSVGTSHLINGAVTSDKLDPNILPVGMTAMWYRADSAVLPPSGWEVMDGRAWSTITNKLGAGGTQWNTGNIPNMSNKFALGAALAGTGTGPTTPPGIGAVGGAHERDLSHTHTTNAHSHTVNSHAHSVVLEAAHSHVFSTMFPLPGGGFGFGTNTLFTRDVGVPKAEGTRQAVYLPGHNAGGSLGSDIPINMTNENAHDHGGATGTAAPGTSSVAATVNTSLTGNQDLRPAFVGLLYIMKVR